MPTANVAATMSRSLVSPGREASLASANTFPVLEQLLEARMRSNRLPAPLRMQQQHVPAVVMVAGDPAGRNRSECRNRFELLDAGFAGLPIAPSSLHVSERPERQHLEHRV